MSRATHLWVRVGYATFLLGVGIVIHVSASNARNNTEQRADSVRVFYLAANVLHGVELRRATRRAIEESTWALPRTVAREDYAGLSCDGGGIVVAHVSRNVGGDPLRARQSDIVLLDVSRRTVTPLGIAKDTNLGWPVISPDGIRIAATAFGARPDTLAIVDRSAKTIKLIEHPQSVAPHSWSAQGDKIYVTAVEKSGQASKVFEYSVRQGSFAPLATGSRPVSSGSNGLLAFLDPERGEIKVNDSNGAQVARIRKGFKDIIGWIDNAHLLAIGSTGGPDNLGIVDIRSREVLVYNLATHGEINGACIVPSKKD